MTAEIAVLNRLAVALASDSAASVKVDGRTKLFHADKLFMLSHCRPVGVMVNNSSLFLNVPWETLIKLFREELGWKSFPHLKDYSDAFVAFLQDSRDIFTKELQDDIFIGALRSYFSGINDAAIKQVFLWARDTRYKDENVAYKAALDQIISKEISEWAALPIHPAMVQGMGYDYVTGLSGRVNRDVINSVFGGAQDKNTQQALNQLSHLVVERQGIILDMYSDVVIAGFGDKDTFPVLRELEFSGMYKNRLKCRLKDEQLQISGKRPGVIRAFGQSEVAETFLFGSNPRFYRYMADSFTEFMIKGVGGIVDGVPGMNQEMRDLYKDLAVAQVKDGAVELLKKFRMRWQNDYYSPIEQAVAHLPKNELAQVAATLVSLSSFQKRVSINEEETVGGPVDVAVITRGDGFVWLERKHYFKPELNSHFFNMRRAQSGHMPNPGAQFADSHGVHPSGDVPQGAQK